MPFESMLLRNGLILYVHVVPYVHVIDRFMMEERFDSRFGGLSASSLLSNYNRDLRFVNSSTL